MWHANFTARYRDRSGRSTGDYMEQQQARKFVGPSGLVILVCFFLPWITISCASNPLEDFDAMFGQLLGGLSGSSQQTPSEPAQDVAETLADLSGFTLATGAEVMGRQAAANPWLWLVFLGGAALALSGALVWNEPRQDFAWIGAAAGAIVVLLCLIFWQRVATETQNAGGMLEAQYRIGFHGTWLAGLIGGIASYLGRIDN